MNTALLCQIDQLSGLPGGANDGFHYSLGSACNCNGGPVVGGVERPIQQTSSFDLHSSYDLTDFCGVCSFREVGDALDDGCGIHRTTNQSIGNRELRVTSTRSSRGRIGGSR